MKVLLLATDVFSKGGISRYTRYQARALRELLGSDNVYVFSLHPEDECALEEDLSVDYTGRGTRLSSKVLFASKAIDFVRRIKVDLMVCNHVQLTPIALVCKGLFGTRYLMNAYGMEIWSGLKRREILGLRNADGVLGDCRFILDYINAHLDRKVNKYLLYDCVDTDRFGQRNVPVWIYKKYNIPQGLFKILTVAALYRYKGHELVIRALSEGGLREREAVYMVVGDGSKRDYLEKLVAERGLAERVLFLGGVPESDLVFLYNAADVFVLISRFGKGEGEGLPLALIEASACQKPIIAGSEDGSSEAVEDGVSGYCVGPEDTDAVSSLLVDLLENPDKRAALGNEGRNRVLRRFSYEEFKKNIAGILEDF